MEFSVRKNRHNTKKIITDSLSELYPHDLQMYTIPPGKEITLSEFEDLALERLQLLRILEQASQKGHKIYSEDWKSTVMEDLRKQKLHKYLNLLFDSSNELACLQARRADHISHFILRLAYCRSENLRRWFLSRELEWFKLRFISKSKNENYVSSFLKLNKLTYTAISSDEKEPILDELYNCTYNVYDARGSNFYKVPFSEVYSLVKKRQVYMSQGYAYIPDMELVTCILSVFRTQLSEALAYASHKIPLLDDDRLNNLLVNLHTTYTGRDYSAAKDKGAIDIQCLDEYSRKHYPLCMRNIHETFRANHHLKHNSRMQYLLFIKAIGVTFEDCMRFWMEEFTKLIDQNQFEKQYSYLVKHAYGKVGRMVSYSAYSCMKIIMGNVGAGETHGCPFRHFDSTNLHQKLTEYGINGKVIEEINGLVKNMHYQIACSKYFEITHGQASKDIINHPNQYFEESRSLQDAKLGTLSVKTKRQSLGTAKHEEIWNEEMEI